MKKMLLIAAFVLIASPVFAQANLAQSAVAEGNNAVSGRGANLTIDGDRNSSYLPARYAAQVVQDLGSSTWFNWMTYLLPNNLGLSNVVILMSIELSDNRLNWRHPDGTTFGSARYWTFYSNNPSYNQLDLDLGKSGGFRQKARYIRTTFYGGWANGQANKIIPVGTIGVYLK